MAAAAAGEPVRTGRQGNASTERTEESRGWRPRRLGDPVREPGPSNVAAGSLGRRDGRVLRKGGKGEGRSKRGIPANFQPRAGPTVGLTVGGMSCKEDCHVMEATGGPTHEEQCWKGGTVSARGGRGGTHRYAVGRCEW